MISWAWIAIAQGTLIAASIWWLWKRNDEFLTIVNVMIAYFSSYRFYAVHHLQLGWIDLANFSVPPITDAKALLALNFIFLGQTALCLAYATAQNKTIALLKPEISPTIVKWLRPKIMWLGFISLPVVVFVKAYVDRQLENGVMQAYGMSAYLYQFPLMLLGLVTLLIALWRLGGLPSRKHQLFLLVFIAGVAWLTYGPEGRFQFLGWMAAASIVLGSTMTFKSKLLMAGVAGALMLGMFTFAGAMRDFDSDQRNEAMFARAIAAEDANMLDGFVISAMPYGTLFPYRYGGEHLGVLLRIIPRAWWPDKPISGGDFARIYGLNDPGNNFTLGFSPSLFGSFYIEGGAIGIILFSIIYGLGAGKLMAFSQKVKPFAGVIMRAVLCASCIPLLRGGDLAGIYAWIGMAFWPCFGTCWFLREEMGFVHAKPQRFSPIHRRRRSAAGRVYASCGCCEYFS